MFLVPKLLYNYLCPSVCPSLKYFATYGCCHPCFIVFSQRKKRVGCYIYTTPVRMSFSNSCDDSNCSKIEWPRQALQKNVNEDHINLAL